MDRMVQKVCPPSRRRAGAGQYVERPVPCFPTELQHFYKVNKPGFLGVHQPIRLGTLGITSSMDSKVLGAFLLAAKEGLKREIRSGNGYGSTSCTSTALRAHQAHAPSGARSARCHQYP